MKLADLGAMLCILALSFGAGSAAAATYDDPDWPCIQRKVDTLSIAQMWAGPPPEGNWRDDAAARALAARIAPRRTPVEEVEALVTEFAAGLDPAERPERLARVFAAVLHAIEAERGQIITGIGRYARKQADLSARVADKQEELVALKAEAVTDLDRVEELEDTLAWDVRVFRERAQSLTYVCETPVLLEQRAFAIGRLLAAAI
jgi:hypothetical protein